jgi:hypothetical protein
VILNFTAEPRRLALPRQLAGGRLVLSTHSQRQASSLAPVLTLEADEGVILDVTAA